MENKTLYNFNPFQMPNPCLKTYKVKNIKFQYKNINTITECLGKVKRTGQTRFCRLLSTDKFTTDKLVSIKFTIYIKHLNTEINVNVNCINFKVTSNRLLNTTAFNIIKLKEWDVLIKELSLNKDERCRNYKLQIKTNNSEYIELTNELEYPDLIALYATNDKVNIFEDYILEEK